MKQQKTKTPPRTEWEITSPIMAGSSPEIKEVLVLAHHLLLLLLNDRPVCPLKFKRFVFLSVPPPN